ncbi:nitroreductase family deazaflavin-dependent oxidoreductase [Pseudonocardia ailaonensis]|uniref:Nitroreductase family deazaflavin-dependent oxidoreductase n=1 Tax=Pseudonocardia ailaonensis TaxID=367279 RepID=A0ABN2NDG4_9PSEU
MPDVVAINAQMTRTILDGPAQPLAEGGYALRVLRSTGRRSGATRETPLGVLLLDGREYLVSPDPTRAWVHNLRAEPVAEIASADGSVQVTAALAGPGETTAAVAAYLRAVTVPWALRAFPVGPDASVEEIAEHLDSLAVFRLEPR